MKDMLERIEEKIDSLNAHLKSVALALQIEMGFEETEEKYHQTAIELFELIIKTYKLEGTVRGTGEHKVYCGNVVACTKYGSYCSYCKENKAETFFVPKESVKDVDPVELAKMVDKKENNIQIK